jgi:hypothetical protein
MKRRGPLNGSGPRSERKLRVAGERSHSVSDTGRASPTPCSSLSPLSKPTAPATPPASAPLDVTLIARGRGRFDVSFDHTQIVTSSAQPMCDAARVLHRLGYPDDTRLVAWHEGSDHHAISGRLGFWRKRRIREDRSMPRYVAWEARPRRVGAKKGVSKLTAAEHPAEKKSAPTTAPGADKRLFPATLKSKPGGTP